MAVKKKQQDLGTIRAQVHALNQKLQDVHETTTDYIAENPMKATLVALGIGLVAGAVIMKLLEK